MDQQHLSILSFAPEAPWILDTPDREDGRRAQDSPAWVHVPIDKGSAETDQAAVLDCLASLRDGRAFQTLLEALSLPCFPGARRL